MARTRRSSLEVRGEILRVAEEAFAQHGYGGVKLKDVAREADTTESVLYRYFPSKSALFRESVLHPVLEVLDAFASASARYIDHPLDDRSMMRLVLGELLEQLRIHRSAIRSFVAVEEDLTPLERDEFHNAMIALVGRLEEVAREVGSRRGLEEDDPAIAWGVRLALGAMISVVSHDRWLLPGLPDEPSRTETVEHITTFMLRAMNAD
jgi:AcrR family transcriptional regulator